MRTRARTKRASRSGREIVAKQTSEIADYSSPMYKLVIKSIVSRASTLSVDGMEQSATKTHHELDIVSVHPDGE